ncbi:MAG: S-DNA-T family DNA segregation ATPase FtsK/SpoIIIE [Verrucomicrobiales bacterium]|jgi:S-DNA-T family DNA segregation ATPase FtsK/SpoIIIE
MVNKRATKSEEVAGNPWNEFIAIVLLSIGLLLFLSMISYSPGDLPNWLSFSSQDVQNDPVHNIIGPLGAMIAGFAHFLFGAPAYLIPAVMIWFGVAKLLSRMSITWRHLLGFSLFLLAGSCLMEFQTWFLNGWKDEFNVLSSGGCVGWFVGGKVVAGVIGTGGAFLVMGLVYMLGLVLLSGFLPVSFFVVCRDAVAGMIHQLQERRGLVVAGADNDSEIELKRIEREERRLKKERDRIEKKLNKQPETASNRKNGKKKAVESVESEEGVSEEEGEWEYYYEEEDEEAASEEEEEFVAEPELPLLPATPEPKIIDSSVRDSAKKKLSLAEWRKQRDANRGDDKAGNAPRRPSPLGEAFKDYDLPDLDLLEFEEDDEARKPADVAILRSTQDTIIRTLASFGVNVTAGDITRGPTITRYEIYPSDGLRINRITALEADIARATRAERINILAPIPGKDTVGLEIANSEKVAVPLRELLEDEDFQSGKCKLPLALGKDVYGNTIIADLASMPHLLVAGATGSGKSVCINSIIASLLFQFTPDQLRFIMIDPKVVEMQNYNNLPHLVIPVVTDPKKVLLALRWVVNEMERRYKVFAQEGVRNFDSFNDRKPKEEAKAKAAAAKQPFIPGLDEEDSDAEGIEDIIDDEAINEIAGELEEMATHAVRIEDKIGGSLDEEKEEDEDYYSDKLEVPDSYPYIVVIIDELADLMQTAPADVELAIARITQMARAAGIHLIVATQTPRADVITGVIKANIPTRIAFQVSSALDSRVILDVKGAEKLVGKGDMLYLPPGSAQQQRAQGAFVTDDEIGSIVEHCKKQARPIFEESIQNTIESAGAESEDEVSPEDEEILEKCLDVIQQEKRASTSLLQRRLRLGYTRAARMIDILEQRGIIGPGDGAKPREILVDLGEGIE